MLPLTGVQINEFTIQSEPSWLSLVLLVMAGGTAEAKGTCCPPAPIQADPALKACAALSLSDAAAAQEETHAPHMNINAALSPLMAHHTLRGLGRACDPPEVLTLQQPGLLSLSTAVP